MAAEEAEAQAVPRPGMQSLEDEPLCLEEWEERRDTGKAYHDLMNLFHDPRLESEWVSKDQFIAEGWSLDTEPFNDAYPFEEFKHMGNFIFANEIEPYDYTWTRLYANRKYPDPDAEKFDSVSILGRDKLATFSLTPSDNARNLRRLVQHQESHGKSIPSASFLSTNIP
jgi:hypothetical protein